MSTGIPPMIDNKLPITANDNSISVLSNKDKPSADSTPMAAPVLAYE